VGRHFLSSKDRKKYIVQEYLYKWDKNIRAKQWLHKILGSSYLWWGCMQRRGCSEGRGPR
jgi:hypothetical protein